jgi:hypothetical protein
MEAREDGVTFVQASLSIIPTRCIRKHKHAEKRAYGKNRLKGNGYSLHNEVSAQSYQVPDEIFTQEICALKRLKPKSTLNLD